MSDTTDLVVIEKANVLTVFKSSDQIEEILEKVEREVMSFVPDVSTAKGRKEIASLAYRVAQTKTYLDSLGKDLVAELKEIPKLIDGNRKTVRDRLDALKEKARQPLSDYEAEQQRIKEEGEARIAAEKLAAEVETAHEMALLMNKEFDRERAEAAAEAERQRIAHEEEIKQRAIEQARQEAEAQAQRERQQHQDALSEISGIQQQVIIAQSGRSGVRKGGTTQCIKDTLAETEAWPIDDRFGALRGAAENAKYQAIEQIKRLLINAETIEEQQKELAAAEQNKQQAIADEKRKAQEEADRIKRETEQKESARLAEEKRISDEADKRAANEAHRKAVGTDVVKGLVEHAGLTREQAIATLKALMSNSIPHTSITY